MLVLETTVKLCFLLVLCNYFYLGAATGPYIFS